MHHAIEWQDIVHAVGAVAGVSAEAISAPHGSGALCRLRNVAIYVAREYGGYGLSDLGREAGRSRTTLMRSHARVAHRLRLEAAFAARGQVLTYPLAADIERVRSHAADRTRRLWESRAAAKVAAMERSA